jgi:DNA-directed RNA polymerase specialized sigma24 family protein
LLAYATRLTGDTGAAEEVFQATLVWAWSHSTTLLEGRCSARIRLLSVARSLAAGERPKAVTPAESFTRRPGRRRFSPRGAQGRQGAVRGELT